MAAQISPFGKAFISYGSYHYDTTNRIIHIICVPVLAFTLVALLGYIPPILTILNHPIRVSQLFVFIGISFYAKIHLAFAVGSSVFALVSSVLWSKFTSGCDSQTMLITLMMIHVISWVFQFIGHGVFQKRKPALLDNITQILVAPLFVAVEIWDILGFSSAEVIGWKEEVKREVTAFRKGEAVKKAEAFKKSRQD